MKKKLLETKVQTLEKRLSTLQLEYNKLQKDRLTLYNLLYKVNKELDDALANKQTFISSMSHELRSPLTAVLGNSALLAQTNLTTEQNNYLEQLNESAEFLMSLLSDLLDVSKLKESKVALNIQEIDLEKLLLSCVSMVESRISKEVEVVTTIPSLEYYAFADKKRVQQIFVNLLTNAAKFTQKGKIEFSVVEINEIDKQLEVIIDIKDTGLGIPSEIKERLFEPFTSTDVDQGTGLGLYISHELVTLMGGEITVDSVEGEGTSFRVQFFCEKSGLKMTNFVTNAHASKAKKVQSYAHLKVLVVEDIKLSQEFLKEMFKVFFALTIEVAENGLIGVQKAEENHYDIIFMDIQMPVMNGLDATREIRKFNEHVPIVCMSANVYREDKHNAQEAGMNDFIEKPLEYTDIASRLNKIEPLVEKIIDEAPKDNQQSLPQMNLLEQQAMQHLQECFDEETSRSLLGMAKDGLQENLEKLEESFTHQNFDALKENFHTIQGILVNLGLSAMGEKVGLLQDYAYERDFEKIEKGMETFIVELKAFFI